MNGLMTPGGPETRASLQNRVLSLEAQAKRMRWIIANGPCQMCNGWDRLTIDHIDRKLKDPILRKEGMTTQDIFTWPDARRDKELANCQVLCETHHRYKSHAENIYDREVGQAEHAVSEAVVSWLNVYREAPDSPEFRKAEVVLGQAVEALELLLARGIVL